MWNDLEPAVLARHPDIGRLVRALDAAGASHAAMSGSGSAVFGLFESRTRAERATRTLARPSSPAVVTRTIGRRTYASGSRPAPFKA
jgi:4-diphosphocytidyl-2-C-methyl-D-erythritol kinase